MTVPNRREGTTGQSTSSGRNGQADARSESALPNTPVPKTRLSADDLEMFRQMLLAKRQELVGTVSTMENEALRKTRSDASGDLSMMPIHMADIGTDNYEQEFTLGLIANEREMVKEIDEALQRIENGTYGICEATHKPITKARLHAKPWARYCLEYKQSQEQNRRR